MGSRPWFFVVLIGLLAACSSAQGAEDNSPRLLQDVTLPPTTLEATRVLSPTPQPASTSELVSPLEIITIEADFVLVTPTLPPSKTPTQTPTITRTPTESPTPTRTVTATAAAPIFPTSLVIQVTAIISQPLPQVCDSAWFFLQPRPASCPLSAPLSSRGVIQVFQNGYMVWVQQQDAIYVFYNDAAQPRWQVFNDKFDEGMPEDDPAYANAPNPGTWQPRRGFGMLWRGNEAVRQRIGWAVEQWERYFSVQTQTGPDGTIFISEPGGGVFSAMPGGLNWQLFSGGYTGF